MQVSSNASLSALTCTEEDSASTLGSIETRVERLIQKFAVSNSMVMAPDGSCTGVSEAHLRHSLHSVFVSERPESYKFWSDETGPRYCVRRVAVGTSCKVYLFIDLQAYMAGAFKVCRHKTRNSIEVLKQRLDHERDVLTAIHAKDRVWGIQDKPYGSLTLTVLSRKTGAQKVRYGVLHPFYHKNYHRELSNNPTFTSELEYVRMHQILSAVRSLHQQNILSGDIKLDNILLRGDLTHLTDLSTCATETTPTRDLVAGNSNRTRSVTHGWTRRDDFTISTAFAQNNEREAVIKVEKARDMYALGLVLYAVFAGEFPYTMHNDLPTSNYCEITKPHVADELKSLIRKLCSDRYQDRPSADEAFELFEAYLHQHQPTVCERIQALKSQLEYA